MTINEFRSSYRKSAEQQAIARRKLKMILKKESVDNQLQYVYTRQQSADLLAHFGLQIRNGKLLKYIKDVK